MTEGKVKDALLDRLASLPKDAWAEVSTSPERRAAIELERQGIVQTTYQFRFLARLAERADMHEGKIIYVLEAVTDQGMQMWGAFSTEAKLRAKAVEIRRNVGPAFHSFFCNEVEMDTGAITSQGFTVTDEDLVKKD